jgi:hypothetical protein
MSHISVFEDDLREQNEAERRSARRKSWGRNKDDNAAVSVKRKRRTRRRTEDEDNDNDEVSRMQEAMNKNKEEGKLKELNSLLFPSLIFVRLLRCN